MALRRAGWWLMLALAGCGDATPDAPATPTAPRPRVALFGVDGATFDVIDPLVRQGRLPVLAGLLERGARAVLQADLAEGPSPVLWASIATGARKAEHGILGFTRVQDGQRTVYTSLDRRLPALWNMVDARGGSVGLVGWWNTWPAEPVRGWIVSDLLATSLFKRNFAAPDPPGLTWPPELAAELQPLVHQPSALRRADLAPLGEFNGAEWEALSADDSGREYVVQDGLAALKYGLQSQRTHVDVALHLLRTRPQPDLFFVFLELPDRVGHNFWHAWEPDKVQGGAQAVDAAWRERWRQVVPGAYELVDQAIGSLLAELDAGTTIFVLSDHGFQSSGQPGGRSDDLAHVGGSGTHHPDGVLIAAGPAIRAGARCEARQVDVVPTVLAALGLPGTRQGLGRVLQPLIAPEFLATHPLPPPRDEPPLRRDAADRPGAPDAELQRRLQALGYLLGPQPEEPAGDGRR